VVSVLAVFVERTLAGLPSNSRIAAGLSLRSERPPVDFQEKANDLMQRE
jgi:hypothetical protein